MRTSLIAGIALVVTVLAACVPNATTVSNPESTASGDGVERLGGIPLTNAGVYVWVSPETGCQFLIFNGYKEGAMIPHTNGQEHVGCKRTP